MDINERQNSFSDLLEDIKKEFQTIIADKSHESETGRNQKKDQKESTEELEARLLGPRTNSARISQQPVEGNSFVPLGAGTKFPDSLPQDDLDEDIAKMKSDLNKSYELFQTIGDKFGTINFGSLKTRIRDLHVNKTNNAEGTATAEELEQIFKQKIFEQRLDKLTSEAGANFRKHPGEFGDIPEISQFFQACTQLEHGLEDINRQRRKSKQLGNRLMLAAENSLNRIDDIRSTLSETYKPAE